MSAIWKNFPNWLGSMLLAMLATSIGVFAWRTWGHATTYDFSRLIKFGTSGLSIYIDDLSRLFMVLQSILMLAIAVYLPPYLRKNGKSFQSGFFWSGLLLLLAAMTGVLCSRDAISFIVFWELMSLTSISLVAAKNSGRSIQKATFIYLSATKIAGSFIAAAFLVLYSNTTSLSFIDWNFSEQRNYVPAFLLLTGLCIKAGIWPFHVWLPYAYEAAASPISALLSGFMSKVAMLSAIRFFVFGHLDSPHLIWLTLILGVVTSFWGILFALVQNNMKRVIAYSSIENMGLILISISISMLAHHERLPLIENLSTIAAVTLCVNHALFKPLLFLCCGSIFLQAQTLELDDLGGLAKKMPLTAGCLIIGSFAICCAPFLNGFPGKWFLYQSLFQLVCASTSDVERTAFIAIICILAAVGALAVATFVKLVGVACFGEARSEAALKLVESPREIRAALILLAVACILSGIFAKDVTQILTSSLMVSGEFSGSANIRLPAFTGNVVLIGTSTFFYLLFFAFRGFKTASTWNCGYTIASPKAQISANSFAQPVARIFRPILQYRNVATITGADRKHFPENIHVDTKIVSILEKTVYAPLVFSTARAAKLISQLQAGSVHLYILYVCLTLIALLLLGGLL